MKDNVFRKDFLCTAFHIALHFWGIFIYIYKNPNLRPEILHSAFLMAFILKVMICTKIGL